MQAKIEAAKKRTLARSIPVSLKAESAGANQVHLTPPHSDEEGFSYAMLDTFATTSQEFVNDSLSKLGSVVGSKPGVPEETQLNSALALVDSISPQNGAEAALAVQMAGTHSVAMEMLRKAKFAGPGADLQEYGSLAVKLLRTYTTQMECLAKIRRRGEQKVTVEHVHVYPGGQAVVGNVSQTGGWEGGYNGNEHQPHGPKEHAALAFSPGTEMPGADPIRQPMSIAGNAGAEQVSIPRRRKG